MSWSFSVGKTPREAFPGAVEAATATGQDLALPHVKDDVNGAKTAIIHLADNVKQDIISATANGHSLQDSERDDPAITWHDGVSVSVTGHKD